MHEVNKVCTPEECCKLIEQPSRKLNFQEPHAEVTSAQSIASYALYELTIFLVSVKLVGKSRHYSILYCYELHQHLKGQVQLLLPFIIFLSTGYYIAVEVKSAILIMLCEF